MPKVDDLVHAPFPLPDPELVRESVWITQNGKDYRVSPTRLGYVFQGDVEPIDPFKNQLWWDTSPAARALKTSAFLRVFQRNRWHGIGPLLDPHGNATIPGTLDVVGGLIAGWLLPMIGIFNIGGIVGAIICSVIGAVILLLIVGLIKR